MNLVDSCGWLEYFAGVKYLQFYRDVLLDLDLLIVPTICICEVYKKVIANSAKDWEFVYLAAMKGELIVD